MYPCFLGCNETIYAQRGIITSENYPDNYPPSTICTYHIQAPPGIKLKLTVDMMDIENDKKCSYDFVRVKNSQTWLTDRICGNRPMSPMVIPDNDLYIYFESDDENQYKGFKVEFNHVLPEPSKSIKLLIPKI